MPDTEISRLQELLEVDVQGSDPLAIADLSAAETKKVTVTSLVNSGITSLAPDTIDPDKIDWDSLAPTTIDGSAIKTRSLPADRLVANSLTAAEIAPNAIGSSELANGAVDTAALLDSAVTADKVADDQIGDQHIVPGGLDTPSIADGAITNVKLDLSDNSIDGSVLVSDSVTALQIAPDAIGVSELADGSVDTAAVQANAITANELATDSVQTRHIASGQVDNDALADGSVSVSKTAFNANEIDGSVIVNNSLTATQIAPDAIGANELADLAVDEAALQDGSVTAGKIAGGQIDDTHIQADGISAIAAAAIGTAELADDAVTADKVADNQIGVDALAPNLPGTILEEGAITATELDDLSVQSRHIAAGQVINEKLGSGAVTDSKVLDVDGSKINAESIEASKLDPAAFSDGIELDATIKHSNAITPGTQNGIIWDAQGHITGAGPVPSTDLPIATKTEVGAISVPDGSGLTVSNTGEIDHLTLIAAGGMSGITYDEHGHITATTPLVGSDLPIATDISIGAVSVPVANNNPLAVDGSGDLTHKQSVIVPGVYASMGVDQYGHIVSGAEILQSNQVPGLDAGKITTGQFDTAFIADKAVTMRKLADYSISYIQEAEPAIDQEILHIGCLWFQESTGQLRMWNGNSFFPVGFGRLSQENLRWCGTVNADTGLITTINDAGRTAGFVVGDPIPPATDSLGGAYLVVETAGANVGVVPATSFDEGDWILCINADDGWIKIDAAGGGAGSVLLRLNELLDVDINNPQDGDTLIFNSATNNWTNKTTTADRLTISPAFDGSTTAFTLSKEVVDQNNVTLSISGVIQQPGVDFVVTPGTKTLTFSSAPPTGSEYFVLNQQSITSSGGGGGGGGTTLPPGTSDNELLGWNNSLGAWGPVDTIDGGSY
jgi:hypothetical protein